MHYRTLFVDQLYKVVPYLRRFNTFDRTNNNTVFVLESKPLKYIGYNTYSKQ